LILLDTNILLRYALATDPLFATVDTAITSLNAGGEVLCVVPQSIYEFWAAATRPTASNGLGFSIPECQAEVARIKRLFHLLLDVPAMFAEWDALVGTHACHGRVSYDARLVAAMRTHGITRVLTFNGSDFARFPRLTILDPAALAAPTPPPNATPGSPPPSSAP
jgi:predicted nucleic acid-binding protein